MDVDNNVEHHRPGASNDDRTESSRSRPSSLVLEIDNDSLDGDRYLGLSGSSIGSTTHTTPKQSSQAHHETQRGQHHNPYALDPTNPYSSLLSPLHLTGERINFLGFDPVARTNPNPNGSSASPRLSRTDPAVPVNLNPNLNTLSLNIDTDLAGYSRQPERRERHHIRTPSEGSSVGSVGPTHPAGQRSTIPGKNEMIPMPVPRPTGSYAPGVPQNMLDHPELGEGGLTYAQLHGRRGSDDGDADNLSNYCRWKDCQQ